MTDAQTGIILAISYLAVKHALADFFFQTAYQYKNKGKYGHPGGLLHAAIHVILTLPVFLILEPSSKALAAQIAGAEYVIHYHIDWIKEKIITTGKLATGNPGFWYALGLDQLAHYLTYIGIIVILISR